MGSIKLSLGLTGFALALTVAACAPPEPTSKFRRTTSNVDDEPGNTAGDLGGTSGDDGASTPDEFKSCATKSAAAEAKPVYLVFMFDKSGSMASNNSPKWASAKSASKAFFESAESKGTFASLSFFPDKDNPSCGVNAYGTPQVSMSALPAASFGTSLDSQTPGGGTPTHVALQGAISYAQGIASNEGKDGKVAIVLVTDGLPDSNCTGNSVGAVKDLASSVAATLPTYVIGVGNQLTSLNEIAVGGGTTSAFIVNANDPNQIKQDFLTAINAIKTSALSCDYEIPAPPAGEQLDREKVNVVYKSGGTTDTLDYNASCAGGAGWRYDDADAPKRILLCDTSCDAVKTKPGQMEVLFGCATKGDVK
ncbi:MAG: VWA domain-containing protein [Labilithrix sp.]|nr:VWA domain-containing protein [Labilithrix sp.]MBX3225117.1 VWA domain-containing protein [Labilithrix sp.]